MTIKSFWIILLRLIGLWFAIQSLTIIYQLVASIFIFSSELDLTLNLVYSSTIALTLIFYWLISYFCLFKTALIIDKLKLDSGFPEEKIELNNNQNSIVVIAVLLIGGILFISALPALINDIISYLKVNVQYGQRISDLRSFEYFNLFKVIIGLILMTNSRLIANLMVRPSNSTDQSDTEQLNKQ